MPTIAGASQYLNASSLANSQGLAARATTVLGEGDTSNLLESGRRALAVSGLGISSSARALNQQFLSNSSDINAMFSLGIGSSATIEGMQQEILALRAGFSEEQLAPSLRGTTVDKKA